MGSAMELTASFSEWLKRQRKGRDLTQLDLAERVGCSESAIRKLELGERRPSKQVAELLAEFFGVPDEERDTFLLFARGRDLAPYTVGPPSPSGYPLGDRVPSGRLDQAAASGSL